MRYYYQPINSIDILEADSLEQLILLIYDEKATLPIPNKKFTENDLKELKKEISKYGDRIPLYDIYSNAIYLIYRENVYQRILNDYYRFIDEQFYQELSNDDSPKAKTATKFLSIYDFKTLQKTYFNVFYESFVLNKYVTNCRRPSFNSYLDHIKPYYDTNELYYFAIDWELIKIDKPKLSKEEQENLCEKIVKYDISAKTLIDHQLHIYDNKAIGLVKYYSLFGSYFMNKFLRKYQNTFRGGEIVQNVIRNPSLENNIKLMIELIKSTPAFKTTHTVYRFIDDDSFISHLKPGDIYTDISFMSSTRNPYYYQENYQFGYILMKITLPPNVRGVGLCMESYSNFPKEEEIVLAPLTRLRLEKITYEKSYHHILNKKITKKYEFTWVGNYFQDNEVKFLLPNTTVDLTSIDMKTLVGNPNQGLTVSERIKTFMDEFLNENYQFKSTILGINFTFIMESYDSTSAYKPYFAIEREDGLMIYTINPKEGNINLMIELDDEIHINYYFRFSISDESQQLSLDQPAWIEWLSCLAFVFGVRYIHLHPNYSLHYDQNDKTSDKLMKTRYVYSRDIYLYLKDKKKFYSQFTEIQPNFEYYNLDYYHQINPMDILNQTDRDEIYQLFVKSETKNLAEFYIYIVEKHPRFLRALEDKLKIDENVKISYTLDAWSYLYNKEIIRMYPHQGKKISRGNMKINSKKLPKFENRLRYYLQNPLK